VAARLPNVPWNAAGGLSNRVCGQGSGDFRSGSNVQLAVDVGQVGFDGPLAHEQLGGDLGVGVTDGSTQQVSIGEPAGSRSVQFDLFNVGLPGPNRTYDTPGVELEVGVLGLPGATGSLLLVGRSN
jgi:hypothetical protein